MHTILHIEQGGLLTTIQDKGREGFQQFGMPVAGPMDKESYLLGQALVGNFTPQGALECTLLPPTIRVEGTTVVAFTGADMQPTINGVKVPRYIPFECHDGDIISGSYSICGMRMYISFFGSIDVPSINGSVSTHTKAHIGGLDGRALQNGDTLTIKKDRLVSFVPTPYATGSHRVSNLALFNRGGRDCHETMRVVLGSQADAFTTEAIEAFTKETYRLTEQCDRMGFRLDGSPLEHKESADIISDGAVLGSIQVPADGRPIILMADRQTTGGYTKIGTIITPDIMKLSQLPIGEAIHFEVISIEEAQKLYRSYYSHWLEQLLLAHQQSQMIFTVVA